MGQGKFSWFSRPFSRTRDSKHASPKHNLESFDYGPSSTPFHQHSHNSSPPPGPFQNPHQPIISYAHLQRTSQPPPPQFTQNQFIHQYASHIFQPITEPIPNPTAFPTDSEPSTGSPSTTSSSIPYHSGRTSQPAYNNAYSANHNPAPRSPLTPAQENGTRPSGKPNSRRRGLRRLSKTFEDVPPIHGQNASSQNRRQLNRISFQNKIARSLPTSPVNDPIPPAPQSQPHIPLDQAALNAAFATSPLPPSHSSRSFDAGGAPSMSRSGEPSRPRFTADIPGTPGSRRSSMANSTADVPSLDNFVPHHPQFSHVPYAQNGSAHGFDSNAHSTAFQPSKGLSNNATSETRRYSKRLGDIHSRFLFRRRAPRNESAASPPPQQEASEQQPQDDYFGATQFDEHDRSSEIRGGEEVLIRFLRKTLGPKAQNLAVRLMNKTPITSTGSFAYVIHQGTEESDVDIIRRDLTSGRLYTSGVRYMGGAWCNLLLGDRFSPGSSTRQRHELTYRRSSCSCLICRVKATQLVRSAAEEIQTPSDFGSEMDGSQATADIISTMSSSSRTPTHSAMANFVVRYQLPSSSSLKAIGASGSTRELEIGSVVRLNYRASAKLKFTEDVRELFGHYAYTGPISHEEVYRRVTTIGVHYYLYNKGKKERKVYIQGELIRLPIDIGVVKLGTQPMYMPELGATFCLYRKQIMSIYVGEIVLEGNSIGSFIKTGIRYYIGFGEERGVCPVYPNKTLGKARKLGINELLLHHHMVDDLEVKCL